MVNPQETSQVHPAKVSIKLWVGKNINRWSASFGHRTGKAKLGHNGGTEGANVVRRRGLENFTSDVEKDRTSEAEWFFHLQRRIRKGMKTSDGSGERLSQTLEDTPIGSLKYLSSHNSERFRATCKQSKAKMNRASDGFRLWTKKRYRSRNGGEAETL